MKKEKTNVMACYHCGKIIPSESVACNYCGNKLEMKQCSSCGENLPPTATFCHKCGNKIHVVNEMSNDENEENVEKNKNGESIQESVNKIQNVNNVIHDEENVAVSSDIDENLPNEKVKGGVVRRLLSYVFILVSVVAVGGFGYLMTYAYIRVIYYLGITIDYEIGLGIIWLVFAIFILRFIPRSIVNTSEKIHKSRRGIRYVVIILPLWFLYIYYLYKEVEEIIWYWPKSYLHNELETLGYILSVALTVFSIVFLSLVLMKGDSIKRKKPNNVAN